MAERGPLSQPVHDREHAHHAGLAHERCHHRLSDRHLATARRPKQADEIGLAPLDDGLQLGLHVHIIEWRNALGRAVLQRGRSQRMVHAGAW